MPSMPPSSIRLIPCGGCARAILARMQVWGAPSVVNAGAGWRACVVCPGLAAPCHQSARQQHRPPGSHPDGARVQAGRRADRASAGWLWLSHPARRTCFCGPRLWRCARQVWQAPSCKLARDCVSHRVCIFSVSGGCRPNLSLGTDAVQCQLLGCGQGCNGGAVLLGQHSAGGREQPPPHRHGRRAESCVYGGLARPCVGASGLVRITMCAPGEPTAAAKLV